MSARDQAAVERCRTGCAFMADSRVVPCATCPSRDALTAASPYAMPVTLDGETFASLVGRENRDVYLFRVSEAWLDAMGDNEWHGPVEWRIAREEGRIVTLEMREVRLVEAD